MGLGLELKSRGKHIAFAAGTGILVFLDLVAHLILKIISKSRGPNIFIDNTSIEEELNVGYIDIEDFQFELNASFSSRSEAVGLELIESLLYLCQQTNYK
jgi:hypothetical protein